MLVHSTLGWHTPTTVNSRYQELFARQPISNAEQPTLERLWVLRHSVAHNAGFVIHYDASRIGSIGLAEHVANVDAEFIRQSFDFLRPIAARIASDVGDSVLIEWIRSIAPSGQDFVRDSATYIGLKKLATMVETRTRDLPTPTELQYHADFARVTQP
jgi:hypothetical protein